MLDLLNHCISYPQFVEVLCCLCCARSVSILEPDVKQIRGLTLDEEMQVGCGQGGREEGGKEGGGAHLDCRALDHDL